MIRGTQDFSSGLVYIFFGLSAVILARDYGMGSALKMGPAYFPTILGGLLVLIGSISIARSFLKEGPSIGRFTIKGLAFVIVSTVLFGVTVRGAGLIIALPLLVIVSAFASDDFRWRPTLLLAVGLTVFCVLVFLKGLGIPLAILGSWFGG